MWWHHCFFPCKTLIHYCTQLSIILSLLPHLLQLLLFIFYVQVHFYVFWTPEAWALHALHTRLSSDSPGGITWLMVYWVAIFPKSSPSVVTEACTWSSLRLWLTEGPRDRLEGSYICSDCIYPDVSSNAAFFILVCWTWHCIQRVFINVRNISSKLLHMVLPPFHFLSDQSRWWKEQSAQTAGGLEIQRHKAKVCTKNVSTIAQVVIIFICTTTSIAPAQQVQFTCAG